MDTSLTHWTPFLGPLIEKGSSSTTSTATTTGSAANQATPFKKSSHFADTKQGYAKLQTEQYEEDEADIIHNPEDIKELKASGRLIIAIANPAHRIELSSETGQPTLKPRGGNSALYSSVNHIISKTTWEPIVVSWPGEWKNEHGEQVAAPSDQTASDSQDNSQLLQSIKEMYSKETGCPVEPVWIDTETGSCNDLRYYAENVIWPALHYIQGDAVHSDEDGIDQSKNWWENYVKLNEAFKNKIVEVYKPGDIIWIHDYYLLLLPQLLRMQIQDANIGMFLHAPFPSSEYFRCLPERRQLLEGMLGANLVGFQSFAYCRHFISSCTRIFGVENPSPREINAFGVHVCVEALPIGIDTAKVEADAFNPRIDEKVKAIRALYPDKKIIVGRDRLDSVRGVVQKLEAFEMFLAKYPEWHNKVVLIQVTNPSYSIASKVESKVSELIAHINSTYGMLHFSPVHHYPQHIAKDEYLALLRVADLGLITSVRDGLNTTSLEFVVCQKTNHSPLILSEFTGTAGSLSDAVQVNPWDILEVADTIHNCLLSGDVDPNGNKVREEKLYQYVTTHTVQDWVTRFLTRLVRNVSTHTLSHVTPALDVARVVSTYHSAAKRLIMLDYDGTLTPIVKTPSAAIPSEKLLLTLKALCDDPKNDVWIISGRDAQFLDKWLGSGNDKISFSAEHGCFVKKAGAKEWTNLTEHLDMSWLKIVKEIFDAYTERTHGSTYEEKKAALTWHYRNADPVFGLFEARNLRDNVEKMVASHYDIDILEGKANVEVRPKAFNKGNIVKRIIEESDPKPDFILCLGDEPTDEDMFRSISSIDDIKDNHGTFSVTVGPPSKKTAASWHLLDPAAVLDTLGKLVT